MSTPRSGRYRRSLRLGAAALAGLVLCCLAVAGGAYAQQPPTAGWAFDDPDTAGPTALDLLISQGPDIALFAAFAALALVSFFRKSLMLKYATLVACVLYMGVYKSQLVSIVNVFGAVTGNLPILTYNLAWYVFALFVLVTTVLFGRLYCGRFCAFGALTQLIDAVVPARWRVEVPERFERPASYVKYAVLFGAIGYYLATREIGFYRYIEPFWMFSFSASAALWTALAALLVASVFVR
ncbi:MAG TPA: 4Fe-4S binding protein, partial [Gammaproteobacteria bacterium]|nr:4Fe-4S binding protein [Gammaproteobacteria bacterium]